jgi:hypothetical protein
MANTESGEKIVLENKEDKKGATPPPKTEDGSGKKEATKEDVNKDIVVMPTVQTPSYTEFTLENIFTSTNLIFIIWFLSIYFVVYFLIKMFTGNSGNNDTQSSAMLTLTRTFDFVVLSVFAIIVIFTYFTQPVEQKQLLLKSLYTDLVNYVNNPISLVSLGIFIFILYLAVYLLGIPMNENKPVSVGILENGSWILFVVTLIVVFFNNVLNVSITDFVRRLWNDFWNIPEPDDKKQTAESSGSASSPPVSVSKKEEVFHISNNLYNYEDAQTICSSYGSRLATYDEIEKAYNNGAEWCGYGWSSDQMAFFPTQKKTWEKLQKTTNHKNDCGRTGVNGGYMANPELRFGVNCYGVKPAPTDADLAMLSSKKDMIIPKTVEDVILDKKVQFWKENQDKLLQLSSFNSEKWSAY